MAKAQDIKRRIRSISNTMPLTKAKKMVSAAIFVALVERNLNHPLVRLDVFGMIGENAIKCRRGIVGLFEPDEDTLVGGRGPESPKCGIQTRGPELRRTAAAVHRFHPHGFGSRKVRGGTTLGIEHAETTHEAAVYPVLELPDRRSSGDEAALLAQGATVAQIQQGQEVGLRPVASQRAARESAAQVRVEHRTLAHGVDPRLGHPVVSGDSGTVARRKESGPALDFERVAHPHEPGRVAR